MYVCIYMYISSQRTLYVTVEASSSEMAYQGRPITGCSKLSNGPGYQNMKYGHCGQHPK